MFLLENAIQKRYKKENVTFYPEFFTAKMFSYSPFLEDEFLKNYGYYTNTIIPSDTTEIKIGAFKTLNNK